MTLADAPIAFCHSWGMQHAASNEAVIALMRTACFAGVELLSERQPPSLLVENSNQATPQIWAEDRPDGAAWIKIQIKEDDLCKVAYQFGHELGHVTCNTWGSRGYATDMSQWVEEVCVEAFSLCGLKKPGSAVATVYPRRAEGELLEALRRISGKKPS